MRQMGGTVRAAGVLVRAFGGAAKAAFDVLLVSSTVSNFSKCVFIFLPLSLSLLYNNYRQENSIRMTKK